MRVSRSLERTEEHRFPVGTRVIYRVPPGGQGNIDLDGRTGVVIYIDSSACPYTVRLDERYDGAVCEVRVGEDAAGNRVEIPVGAGVYGEVVESGIRRRVIPNCWFCKEENLVARRGRRPGGGTEDDLAEIIAEAEKESAGWRSKSVSTQNKRRKK